jgi:uncharacterized circularly permuted ATP-grasp superfamily protein
MIAAHAEREDVEAMRAAVRAAPGDHVAQRLPRMSEHPTAIDDELRPRHVDLRPFAFMRGGREAAAMPGGLTRVAFEEGAIVVKSTQDGGAKDRWALP